MNRIDRLMAIVSLLQTKKNRTAGQLAEHFRISERTVFRDLRALAEIGVPIAFEAEKGYAIGPGYFLPPVSLTIDEANALSLAEPLVMRFSDRSVHRHFASALEKIKLALGRSSRESFEKTRAQTAHFVPDQWAHLMPSAELLAPLQTAIAERRIVRIAYENASGEASERDIEPIGLTFYSLNWHLIAWCWLRREYRDFRVSRIKTALATMRAFEKNDHRSLAEHLQFLQKTIDENL